MLKSIYKDTLANSNDTVPIKERMCRQKRKLQYPWFKGSTQNDKKLLNKHKSF